MKKILLYTGPVKSGKSSRLLSFVQNKKDIGGILSIVIDKKKYLYNISSGEKRLLEAESGDSEMEIINVGSFTFKKKVFEWGNEVLKKAAQKKYSYLIIDEIGLLELAGEGLSPAANEIIKNFSNNVQQIIVVVRESLLNKFLDHFKIDNSKTEYFSTDT